MTTRYWPLSEITREPMHHSHTWELMCAEHARHLSEGTMHAASQAAGRVKPCGAPLAVIETVRCSTHRVYTDYPDFADFERLERAGFVGTETVFFFMVETLH